MPTLSQFAACDPSIGRFTVESLDDQTLMEMLIANASQEYLKDTKYAGEYIDKCDWKCCVCDDDHNVRELYFHTNHYRTQYQRPSEFGTLDMQFLPLKTEIFEALHTVFSGEIETSKLPGGLRVFHAANNLFHGAIDAESLPPALIHFDIDKNQCGGSLDLKALPEPLEVLNVARNSFLGTISLDALPKGLRILDLSENELYGTVQMRKLPESLTQLQIARNRMTGEIDFSNLPPKLSLINVGHNKFSGCVFLPEAKALRRLDADGNAFSGTAVLPASLGRAGEVDLDETAIRVVHTPDGGPHPYFVTHPIKNVLSDIDRISKKLNKSLR